MKLPKAKDYPKTIQINDETYLVKMTKVIKHKSSHPKDNGLCDFDRRTIHIRNTQSPRGLFRTFLHEVLHAMAHEYDFKLKHPAVYGLEKAIDAFLADNNLL